MTTNLRVAVELSSRWRQARRRRTSVRLALQSLPDRPYQHIFTSWRFVFFDFICYRCVAKLNKNLSATAIKKLRSPVLVPAVR